MKKQNRSSAGAYDKTKGSSAQTFVRDRTPFFCFINLSAKWVAFAGQQEKDVHSAA